jgi:hypothetical protein
MSIRTFAFAIAAFALSFGTVRADESPTTTAPATASESAFISAMQADLRQRFATIAEATSAGYVRYTNPDDTGAISYADMHWQSTDVHHPSQLWYDRAGNLLGADYSVLATGKARPNLWGILPGRWYEFDDHVHYVKKDPRTGALVYDQYVMANKFKAAGGDVRHPAAVTLVNMHRVKSTADVATIFDFPAIWDLVIWVKYNPKGAFAEKNPLVKP